MQHIFFSTFLYIRGRCWSEFSWCFFDTPNYSSHKSDICSGSSDWSHRGLFSSCTHRMQWKVHNRCWISSLWTTSKSGIHLPFREGNQLHKQGACTGKVEYLVSSVDRDYDNFIPNPNLQVELNGTKVDSPCQSLHLIQTCTFRNVLSVTEFFLHARRQNITRTQEIHHKYFCYFYRKETLYLFLQTRFLSFLFIQQYI